jgi:hypothetical protein
MAVALGTATTATLANGATTTTFSFISTTGPLYVRVSGWFGGTQSPTGVTYNAVAMTKVADSTTGSGGDVAQIWRLTAPTSGTHNVVVTHPVQAAGAVGAVNATGQDTTTPEGTAATSKSAATGTSTGSLAVSGNATGDLTIVVMANGAAAAVTPSATGGGTVTEEWDLAANGDESEGFNVPDAATAVSASWTGATSWAMAALPLKTTAGGGAADPFPVGYGRWPQRRPPNMRTLLAR